MNYYLMIKLIVLALIILITCTYAIAVSCYHYINSLRHNIISTYKTEQKLRILGVRCGAENGLVNNS